MKDKSKISLYILLVLIFGVAKEELILNEEIVIITSFLLSISLVYSLTAKDISETLNARSIEYINIFEKVNNINYQIVKNIKQVLENIKELQKELKRKISYGRQKHRKNFIKKSKTIINKSRQMSLLGLNLIGNLKFNQIEEKIN